MYDVLESVCACYGAIEIIVIIIIYIKVCIVLGLHSLLLNVPILSSHHHIGLIDVYFLLSQAEL